MVMPLVLQMTRYRVCEETSNFVCVLLFHLLSISWRQICKYLVEEKTIQAFRLSIKIEPIYTCKISVEFFNLKFQPTNTNRQVFVEAVDLTSDPIKVMFLKKRNPLISNRKNQ